VALGANYGPGSTSGTEPDDDAERASLDLVVVREHLVYQGVRQGDLGDGGRFRSGGRAYAGPGMAPSASLSRVQTFMLTTTATISRISSQLKCWASASWKRWNAASRSVSAARVSASV
jgi:hypothetical protein